MITKEQVIEAHNKWGDGIVKIGSLRNDREKCVIVAKEFIERLYSYDFGKVLFKPTRASDIQFRFSKDGALSYFIGGDSNYPEDDGFAINPWFNVRFENEEIILEDEQAISMGNIYFTTPDKKIVKVEFTFGYKLFNGELKIFLQHSSVPYKKITSK
ncbi:MAG: hypothetical protein JW866_05140 [Ignavibacteriales bacterium]|nr:hypothetical protein [Ignavibacteriales bacterium]